MFVPRVEIHEKNVLNRLKYSQSKDDNIGFLLGNYRIPDDPELTITSCSSNCGSTKGLSLLFEETSQILSGETNVVGIWFKTREDVNVSVVEQFCLKNVSSKFKSLCGYGFLVYAVRDDKHTNIQKEDIFYYDSDKNKVASAEFSIVQPAVDKLVTFRIAGNLHIKFTTQKDTDLITAAVSKLEELKEQIKSDMTMFHINNSKITLYAQYIMANDYINEDAFVEEILQFIEEEDDSFSVMKGKKSKKKLSTDQVIDVSVMSVLSKPFVTSTDMTSPVAYYNSGLAQMIHFHLPINAIVRINTTKKYVHELQDLFNSALCKQLSAMANCIKNYSTDEICLGRPFHFQPQGCDHFVTIIYPDQKTDKDLESERKGLHEMLLLPLDRPLLRKCNVYRFPADKKHNIYLENTHIGLKNTGSDGSKVYLVQGTYSYHHYMQDKFNDDKWGCAYRSLQTIVSWFRHQGYTDIPVPSHTVIQQTLVDVGDKDPKFVASKQWIGSIEVCTVLNQLLGVTSKIMCVNSGSEMGNKGRELAHHFETQGTPIMIGGGVLAHTILGVDFNEKSGDLRFLILDPHYTGSEDIKVIQDKGWCGWKGIDFWDQNVFYNLCLPQRPNVI